MATVSVASKLRAIKKSWKNVKPRVGGGLPDGEYEGVITSAVVGLSKSESKRLQCVWVLEVTAPKDFEGRKQIKTAGLETEDNRAYFAGDLAILGVEPSEDSEDIPNDAGQTEGLPVAFKVRTKQEFTNVDFIGLLEGEAVEQPEPDNGTDDGDKGDGLTAEDVTAMGEADDEEALQTLIDEYDLGINQDDYATYAEVANLIIEALQL